MPKKVATILFSLILLFSLCFSSWGYENNANEVDPDDKKDHTLREYTRDNAKLPYAETNDKGYRGGHDTIMNEAALLKKDVHSGDDKAKFEDFVNLALPNLRTGAHDEDSVPWFGLYIKSGKPKI